MNRGCLIWTGGWDKKKWYGHPSQNGNPVTNGCNSYPFLNALMTIRKYYGSLSKFWLSHRIHVWCIYANIGDILMVNVTIYSIHGSYGYGIIWGWRAGFDYPSIPWGCFIAMIQTLGFRRLLFHMVFPITQKIRCQNQVGIGDDI